MQVTHTGHGTAAHHAKDMEYLAHLSAIGSDIIDRSVYAGEDWTHVHAAHGRFLNALSRAYEKKWAVGRQHRAR
ncbi:hypothetical protein [Marinibacterium profundimaris]|uniref:Uncharacterized protein n=1 Tax=Marinibacterium profundimaris TaxID=1679460 RepID=A0A225N9Z1_9RHOB|nr:hypothetical protein [Marinibacterium profundimaris]OWU66425.1 hypothetical protein ATO3_28025 [Marinibacterium profundimaris]